MLYVKSFFLLLLVVHSVVWGAASSKVLSLWSLAWDEQWCFEEEKKLTHIKHMAKILNTGIDPNIGNPLGKASAYTTPLLLVARADVNAPYWPLHDAIKWGDSKKVQLLLAARADANGVNQSGIVPLIQAGMGRYANKGIVELLLDARADTAGNVRIYGLVEQYIQEYKAHPRMYGVRVKQSPKNLLYMASNGALERKHQQIADYLVLCAQQSMDLACEKEQLTEPLFNDDEFSKIFSFLADEEKNEDGETPWWLR